MSPNPKTTWLFRWGVATSIATWILLFIGGTVNPTGSSLACPDWVFLPTCNGDVLPEMVGGVLFEHGHRLWASMTGLMTLVYAVALWLWLPEAPRLRRAGWSALALVVLQGTLGGVTVLLKLSPWVSTLHLIVGISFLALLMSITYGVWRLEVGGVPRRSRPSELTWVALAVAGVFAQIALGGALRHWGAGLICGRDVVGCGPGGLWPAHPLGRLHMAHRFFAYGLLLLIGMASWRAHRLAVRQGRPRVARMAWLPAGLVVAQVLLGLSTVATARQFVVVALHTAIAGLLFAVLFLLWQVLRDERR